MSVIRKGMRVLARDATGKLLERRAATGVVDGASFPVVWVCKEEEWQRALGSGGTPDTVPWPAEDVLAYEE